MLRGGRGLHLHGRGVAEFWPSPRHLHHHCGLLLQRPHVAHHWLRPRRQSTQSEAGRCLPSDRHGLPICRRRRRLAVGAAHAGLWLQLASGRTHPHHLHHRPLHFCLFGQTLEAARGASGLQRLLSVWPAAEGPAPLALPGRVAGAPRARRHIFRVGFLRLYYGAPRRAVSHQSRAGRRLLGLLPRGQRTRPRHRLPRLVLVGCAIRPRGAPHPGHHGRLCHGPARHQSGHGLA
mmetsp:Transcript_99992/g.214214  ORF Transcript_99992/g.214214 Transcript_99992/m.214214 type:complete len:234 (-) Transcript_99992:376-1077(-)